MIQIITTTTKTDRTLKSGAILPAGTAYATSLSVITLGDDELGRKEQALDTIAGRIARSKDKAEKLALRAQFKSEEARGVVVARGVEFLLILSGKHPSIILSNDDKSTLGRALKGLALESDLA